MKSELVTTLKRSRTTQHYHWRETEKETVTRHGVTYDIGKAKLWARREPLPIKELSVEELLTKIPLEDGRIVDHDRLDAPDVDPNVPVFVVTMQDGSLYPVDGRHRLAKALRANRSTVPAVVFSQEDSKKITR